MLRALLRGTRLLFEFLKTVLLIIKFPHSTFQSIATKRNFINLLFIWIVIFFSLVWTEGIRHGVFRHPMFFAVNFMTFFLATVFSFILVSSLMFYLGKFFGGRGDIGTIFLLWGFSYLPTVCWFLVVSFLFVLFPPPRSFSIPGYTLSAVLIAISIGLFYWKLLLYYLTLRIGFRFTWGPIIKVSLILFPIVTIYSIFMYKAGIFKVPFI